MRRVASMPFSSGMATSITATSGLQFFGQFDGFAAVARLAHDLHIRLRAQDQLESLAHHRVVVS